MPDHFKGVKVYLAARYSRREELCGYRAQLEANGLIGHELSPEESTDAVTRAFERRSQEIAGA